MGPALGPDVIQGGAGGLDLRSLGRGGLGVVHIGLHIKGSLSTLFSYLALEQPAPPGLTRPQDVKAP